MNNPLTYTLTTTQFQSLFAKLQSAHGITAAPIGGAVGGSAIEYEISSHGVVADATWDGTATLTVTITKHPWFLSMDTVLSAIDSNIKAALAG
jgi:hypothetical protein